MDKPNTITPMTTPPKRRDPFTQLVIVAVVAVGLLIGLVELYWVGGTLIGHRQMAVSRAHYSDYRFDLSPDGKTMVFAGGDENHPDLYLLDLPSGKVRELLYSREYKQSPLFSHDGTKVLYSAGKDAASGFNLYEIPVTGGQPLQLTKDAGVRDIADFVTGDGIVILDRLKTIGWVLKMGPWAMRQQMVMRPNSPPERDGDTPIHEFGGAGRARELSLRSDPLPTKIAPGASSVRWRWAELKTDYSKHPPLNAAVMASGDGKTIHETAIPKGLPVGRISRARVSPNGTLLYVLVIVQQDDQDYDEEYAHPELWTVDLKTQKCRMYASARLFSDPMSWKPGD